MFGFGGLKIIENATLTVLEQTKFPRSKKKRIRKKFRRKYTTEVPDKNFYRYRGDKIICHPALAQELRRRIPEAHQ